MARDGIGMALAESLAENMDEKTDRTWHRDPLGAFPEQAVQVEADWLDTAVAKYEMANADPATTMARRSFAEPHAAAFFLRVMRRITDQSSVEQ